MRVKFWQRHNKRVSVAENVTLDPDKMPKHIAIIMDGNGRWAQKRGMPRTYGHKCGAETRRAILTDAAELKIPYLTAYAFSTENWRRPPEEVSFLMGLFLQALKKQVQRMHQNNMRLKVIGDRSRFNADIVQGIEEAEALTAHNTGLTLTIAADYGGRWDILQAVNKLTQAGKTEITESDLAAELMLAEAPEPDLFIRTGGEMRVSNFLLWQMAYAELYFTDTLWPDFDSKAFDLALASFQKRERRFGRTSEQLPPEQQREDS